MAVMATGRTRQNGFPRFGHSASDGWMRQKQEVFTSKNDMQRVIRGLFIAHEVELAAAGLA
ncbi:hypothetical protein [Novosphingobium sp. 11B]